MRTKEKNYEKYTRDMIIFSISRQTI